MCLPPKTGTTNWQIAFIENQARNDDFVKLNVSELVPPLVFTKSERLRKVIRNKHGQGDENQNLNIDDSTHKKPMQFLRKILFDKTWINGVNARHPYAKLYSAFSQKFEKNYYIKSYIYYKKFGDLMMLLDAEWRREGKEFYLGESHVASFESFLRMFLVIFACFTLIPHDQPCLKQKNLFSIPHNPNPRHRQPQHALGPLLVLLQPLLLQHQLHLPHGNC